LAPPAVRRYTEFDKSFSTFRSKNVVAEYTIRQCRRPQLRDLPFGTT
jgi:hypothetical protein